MVCDEMRAIVMIWLLVVSCATAAIPVISPESVAVLYNAAIPESRKLAEFYCEARSIPAQNLIAIEMPVTADISREQYEKSILKPLRATFDQRGWWKRQRDAGGVTLPVINRIQVLVTVRGVPLRIQAAPTPPAKSDGKPAKSPTPPADPISGRDEASVDSELAMFGVEGLPAAGVLQNKFYQSDKSFSKAGFPFLVLTSRIDAASYATCERMIRDAVESEKTGLWGMAYVDIANKFPQGDQWLETLAKENVKLGIPTVVDRFNDTLPKNYPMNGAAMYFGWYDWSVSGPFLNPGFKFRRGAVAMHLHSFSAEQLTNVSKNWSAPLLERGAAATIGNVYEPYLHLTHDFGILQQRLLAGYSWVEACWMAMPVTSWQGVVLGDPLYQPFRHLDGSGALNPADVDFRALRAATLKWSGDPAEKRKQLEKAAQRTQSGVFLETAGLDCLQLGLASQANTYFDAAKALYINHGDKLRQDFHRIAADRAAGRKDLAIQGLRDALARYGPVAETEALKGWLDILDPPPPPPADPNKPPAGPALKKP